VAELRTRQGDQSGRASTPASSAIEGTSQAKSGLAQTIASQDWIDRLAAPVQQPVGGALEGAPGLRSVLDGAILGHPAHPALTDVPVGAWTAGLVLDVLDLWAGRRELRPGADAVQAVGLAGALGAALTGLADWSYTDGPARRVGFVHGLANTAVASLYGASLLARARGWRGAGVGLSTVGYGLLAFSAWLGGELSFRYGIGVNRTAFQPRPAEWTEAEGQDGQPVREGDVFEGHLRRVQAAGAPILLTRLGGQLQAIGDTCTHLGCSLSEGALEGDQVVCPCHGSRFHLPGGHVAAGPAAAPAPAFDVRVREGRVELRHRAN
jgi:nitrite reductase/ring-hydroxylating ferredoxin subunit/uncharacterized membrane protein